MTARSWVPFSRRERRNIIIYIIGIMFYKLGLESFNGAISSLAARRFDPAHVLAKAGALKGLNQFMQVVGSILVGPLVKVFPARSVMAAAILTFGFISLLFLIIEAGSGAKMLENGNQLDYGSQKCDTRIGVDIPTNGNRSRDGSWNPNGLFPLYMLAGIAYGMVELIRRIIPCEIVGGDVQKLRTMDAVVHVFYEVAGTGGAILSASMIQKIGDNYSSLITPPLFLLAGATWIFVDAMGHDEEEIEGYQGGEKIAKKSFWTTLRSIDYLESVIRGAQAFARATYRGAIICFSHRKFVWLLPGYSFALYGHRYLEDTLALAIATHIMCVPSYSQIMVSGSNLGELLGAFFVLVTPSIIETPFPFLRFDALALLIVWVLPSYSHQIQPHQTIYAWRIAAMFIPISMGWAAGDVSLSAYIQASLASIEDSDSQVSPLGSVMAFLYSSYIIIYAIMGPSLGSYIDKVFIQDGNIYRALVNVGGVHFTILGAIIIAATLTPRGAIHLNPKMPQKEVGGNAGSDVELHEDGRAEAAIPNQPNFNDPGYEYRQVRVRVLDR